MKTRNNKKRRQGKGKRKTRKNFCGGKVTTIQIPQGRYTGEVINGIPQGRGKIFANNGSIYEGNWQNGNMNGKGTLLLPNGNSYTGDFINGVMEGNGKLIVPNGDRDGYVYVGEFKKNKMDGLGKMKYNSGPEYEGYYKDGLKHGKGKYILDSGSVYEGDFKNDTKEGKGKMKYVNGDMYEGDFKNGEKSGKGKYSFASGAVYDGNWKNDVRDGKGKMKNTNGDIYEGDFKNGGKHGKGKYSFASGAVYEGDFKNDVREGHGIIKYANGSRYDGEWESDKREGMGDMFNADGTLQQCDYWEDDKCINESDYEEDEDDEEDENAEPNVIIKINDVNLTNSGKEININSDATYEDPLEGEVNIQSYLNEDKSNNIVFCINNFFFTSTKDILKRSIDLSDKGNAIVFICDKVYERSFNITKDLLRDETPYFRLRAIGPFGGIVPAEQIKSIVNSNEQYFLITDTGDKAPSVASYSVYAAGGELASASHCQEGQNETIYKIDIFIPCLLYTSPSPRDS